MSRRAQQLKSSILHNIMTTFIVFVIMPFLGAAIGWFAHSLALQFLFKPQQPVKIIGLTVQGLLPRLHPILAERVSVAIARDFLNRETILELIAKADTETALKTCITNKWDEKIYNVVDMVPMAKMILSGNKLNEWRDRIADAFSGNAQEINQFLADAVTEKMDLGEVFKQRILEYDLEHLESVIKEKADREFMYVKGFGGIVGFVVGLASVLIVVLF